MVRRIFDFEKFVSVLAWFVLVQENGPAYVRADSLDFQKDMLGFQEASAKARVVEEVGRVGSS